MNRIAILAAAGVLAPLSAHAQTAPAPQAGAPAAAPAAGAPAAAAVAAGATVVDTQGNAVGTVASIDGANAIVDTGTVKAAIPLTSLGTGPKGPVLAMTKAELEAAAGQSNAQAAADFKSKLAPGAMVHGTGNAMLGTIKAVDAQYVTLTTPKGDAKLPINGFGPGPNGVVTLGMTQAQLDAAMGGAAAQPQAGADQPAAEPAPAPTPEGQ